MRLRESNLVGIDISESSIKVLQLNDAQDIVAYGTKELQEGVVSLGRIIDADAFASALNDVLTSTKPTVLDGKTQKLKAVVCLPESRLFTHYMTIPSELKRVEIAPWIEAEASKIIPIEMDDLYFDHHIVEKGGIRKATFVGVQKSDLDAYMTAFARANVTPAFLIGELFSLGYAVLPEGRFEDDYIIVDIGAHSTTIGIFGEDRFANASIVIPQGGEDITTSVAKELECTQDEAEKKKRAKGVGSLDDTPDSVETIVRMHVDQIIHHIEESRLFFEEKTQDRIEHVILAGGSALLPSLVPYLQAHLRTDVSLAEPLSKVHHTELLDTATPGILFSNVIGLARYALNADRSQLNLLTQYRFQESDTKKEVLPLSEVTSTGDLFYVVYIHAKRITHIAKRVSGYITRYNPRLDGKLIATVLLLVGALCVLFWVLTTYL